MRPSQCPICQEIFVASNEVSALNCGHCFHLYCVEHWFASSKKRECPTCRAKVSCFVQQLFFSEIEGNDDEDPSLLKHKIRELQLEVAQLIQLRDDLQKSLHTTKIRETEYKSRCNSLQTKVHVLREAKTRLEQRAQASEHYQLELSVLSKELKTLHTLKTLLDSEKSFEAAESKGGEVSHEIVRLLKRKYNEVCQHKDKKVAECSKLENIVSTLSKQMEELKVENAWLKEQSILLSPAISSTGHTFRSVAADPGTTENESDSTTRKRNSCQSVCPSPSKSSKLADDSVNSPNINIPIGASTLSMKSSKSVKNWRGSNPTSKRSHDRVGTVPCDGLGGRSRPIDQGFSTSTASYHPGSGPCSPSKQMRLSERNGGLKPRKLTARNTNVKALKTSRITKFLGNVPPAPQLSNGVDMNITIDLVDD